VIGVAFGLLLAERHHGRREALTGYQIQATTPGA
jgi:hypothetical protein